MTIRLSCRSLLIVLFFSSISAFYLPGLAPNVFCRKQSSTDNKCKVSQAKTSKYYVRSCSSLDSNRCLRQSSRFGRIRSTLRVLLVSDLIGFVSSTSSLRHLSFHFCNVDGERSPVENLGQVLFGERIRPSPYKVRCSTFDLHSHLHLIIVSVRLSEDSTLSARLRTKVFLDRWKREEVFPTIDERRGFELPPALDYR